MNEQNEPKVGEHLTVVDDLRIGDLIYYDRTPDGALIVRRLPEWEAVSYKGKVYRVEIDPVDNQVRFIGVRLPLSS